ncbi:MAG: hypothetical protein Kow00121_51610 [Elainellaceae cyanobacterium]
MSQKKNNQLHNTNSKAEKPAQAQRSHDSSQIVNPAEDLVYKGGFSKDPQEIVSNPAVAPQTIDDTSKALRGDLMKDPGEDQE